MQPARLLSRCAIHPILTNKLFPKNSPFFATKCNFRTADSVCEVSRRTLTFSPKLPVGIFARKRSQGSVFVRSMGSGESSELKYRNRLAEEESPYLLQHAHNPVDWYPWGEEAFEKARSENKPIFLSVGYSTCHWCHVMERESFEDEKTAGVMNELYVNIKVDREERPDVDKIYMTYIQMLTGGGGWPMSVFLTPDLKPIYGGTYFPKNDAYNMPSFTKILQRVSDVWNEKREALIEEGDGIIKELEKMANRNLRSGEAKEKLPAMAISGCVAHLSSAFDTINGGFSRAPKFPRPCEVNVLLRQYIRKMESGDDDEADSIMQMIDHSLSKMYDGGIYDHLGGGFHRYSVDELWHVPHFEKMLYDNPQIAVSYLHAFQATGNRKWAFVVRGILDYLRRDMTHPDGGLYSAEDADSLDPYTKDKKTEGAFYVWKSKEISDILESPEQVKVFSELYSVKLEGNCNRSPRSDPHNEFVGKNCLFVDKTVDDVASSNGSSKEAAEEMLAEARKKLHVAREQRPRPHLDDKVVSSWNGMAISAFALASRILKQEDPPIASCFPVDGVDPDTYLEAAKKAANFVLSKLWDESRGVLRRSFCKNASAVDAFSDDYANVIAGLIDLYEASGELEWLQWALKLQSKMDELFWDETGGGYFSTSGADPSILVRMKDDYDSAEATPSSIATGNLFKLAGLFSNSQFYTRGVDTLTAFSMQLQKAAFTVPQMAAASYLMEKWPFRQVVVVGNKSEAATQALLDAVHCSFTPDKVVIAIDPSEPGCIEFWREENPNALKVVEGKLEEAEAKPTVFVCQNFACQAPTSDPAKVKELLSAKGTEGGVATVDLSSLGLGKK